MIVITFKFGGQEVTQYRDATKKEFHPTEVPFRQLIKWRIERRIRALWPWGFADSDRRLELFP